ncbi:glycosyltransferase family 2 protein [Bacillus sp. MBGLi97]|nr:glycosyltransferase family 2 protein [Bacillus sp. MBGLi97]
MNYMQSIEELFKSIVPIKSVEDQSKSLSSLLSDPDYSEKFLLGIRNKFSNTNHEKVSVITCTNKPYFLKNVFKNFLSQQWPNKELIIILNRDDMDVNAWKKEADPYQNIFIFQLPEKISLGYCYNFAIEKASYDYIATFDDDDYYAPNYIKDLMCAFQYTDADIVGKRAHYGYLEARRLLVLRHAADEYTYIDEDLFLDGGKKIMKKKVFDQVHYRNLSNLEDIYICKDSMKKGYKIFSADKYNLVYIRRSNKGEHTWKGEDDIILRWLCTVIARTNDFKAWVTI